MDLTRNPTAIEEERLILGKDSCSLNMLSLPFRFGLVLSCLGRLQVASILTKLSDMNTDNIV